MQPVSEEDLKLLIKEAEAEGKNVEALKKALAAVNKNAPCKAETKRLPTQNGTMIIQSTGPARREDFEF